MKELLDELIEEGYGSAYKLAKATGIDQATLSRLRSGKTAGLTTLTLCRLLAATSNAALQTQLLQVSGIDNALRKGRGIPLRPYAPGTMRE